MLRKTFLTAILSAFIALAQSAEPNRGAGDPDASTLIFPPPEQAFAEVKAYVGLTDPQILQLRQIMQEKSDAQQQVWEQVAQKQRELHQLLQNGSRDVARIGQLALDIHTLSNQPPPSNDSYRQRALNVLTPEQKPKLGPLDQAMKVSTPAYQAVTLNLIDPPPPGRVEILPARTPLAEPAKSTPVIGSSPFFSRN